MTIVYQKKKLVREIQVGERVDDVFVVKYKKAPRPYSKGWMFELRLEDSSDGMTMKFFGPADEAAVRKVYDSVDKGIVVLVRGFAGEYNSRKELTVNKPEDVMALKDGEYLSSDFIRASKKDLDKLYAELLEQVGTVKDDDIRKVLEYFFKDKDFAVAFKAGVGGIHMHHNWTGGLLEHSLNVLRVCLTAKNNYPELDADYLIAGALLQDIGKIREMTAKTILEVTLEGQLVGHIAIGSQMLSKAFEESGTPKEKAVKLMHLLLSHHGENGFGSPKEPAFPEALVVAGADMLDARTQQMLNAKEGANTDDDFVYTKAFGNVYLK